MDEIAFRKSSAAYWQEKKATPQERLRYAILTYLNYEGDSLRESDWKETASEGTVIGYWENHEAQI